MNPSFYKPNCTYTPTDHMWLLVTDLADPVWVRKIKNFLEKHLEDCTLLYSSLFTYPPPPPLIQSCYACLSEEDGSVCGVVLANLKAHQLILHCSDAGVLEAFDRPGELEDPKLILGPYDQVAELVDRWGLRPRFLRKENVYTLSIPCSLPPHSMDLVVGHSRTDDLPILTEWQVAFDVEGLLKDPTDERTLLGAADRIRTLHSQGRLFVLYDSAGQQQPLAMACISGRAPGLVQFGGLYVPEAYRGRGLAKAMVAGYLEQIIQEDGGGGGATKRVVLFTQNPAAEKAYLALGFRGTDRPYSLCFF